WGEDITFSRGCHAKTRNDQIFVRTNVEQTNTNQQTKRGSPLGLPLNKLTLTEIISYFLIATTWPTARGREQYLAQASTSRLRFCNESPRRYARSVSSPTLCPIDSSAISHAKLVWSEAQSRKLDLKPCTVNGSGVLSSIAFFGSGNIRSPLRGSASK